MKSALIYEEWRPIKNYEGLYDISNFGRVRSLNYNHTNKIKILKLDKHKCGYMQVHLYKNNKGKMFLVHRLVYEAFNGLIPEGMDVNHINEIKTDNSVWNLNIMTRKENNNYGKRTEKCSKKCSDQVLQLTLDEVLVKEWSSMAEAHKNGFKESKVSLCCNGKRKTYKGFLWRKKIRPF